MRRCLTLASMLFSFSIYTGPASGQITPAAATPQQVALASSGSAGSTKPTNSQVQAGPTDSKASRTYADALKLEKEHRYFFALEGFRKADKQDGGHCVPCEISAYKSANQLNDYKAEREAAAALVENLVNPAEKARAHFLLGQACYAEGVNKSHDKQLEEADKEFQAALQIKPNDTDCLYLDGLTQSHLKQDGVARERFQQFLKLAPANHVDYQRAQRFAEHPELARARMAPNFRLTTMDGKTVTLESLTGKVVLIDFWATWCGPCREALPRIQQLAHKFEGQPFVVLSISLDREDARWKEFVAKNGMTWTQYRDGNFDGPIATMFGVNAIPATFTIDAEGVLQDQHVGDADIEGKLKKLIARASDSASRKTIAEMQ